ncbi:hypothetical protein GCM10023340_08560 [Nocardioides marinquilinus]|uniref:DNRLRE domain-containing protein n=1 Tax=Nocardioides marinquilinus TaxID=1210400 RepID=A0ABP9PGS4_9ACTN
MTLLAPTAVSVQQSKPNQAYGVAAQIPVSQAAHMLARAGLPISIDEDAVIPTAFLTLTQVADVSGSVTVNLRRAAEQWGNRATWNSTPAVSAATNALTKSNPKAGAKWVWDVTADVQAWAAGGLTNYGWRLNATALIKFKGSSAATGAPVLDVDVLEPGEAPEDLYPDGGAISVAKPTLSFLVPEDTVAVQVQLDANAASPYDFDSGEIPSEAGQVVLADTAFGGLANNAVTSWRARTRGGTGLTAWSQWATFTRVTKPTVTITSPGTTSDDESPTVLWSVTGGTQEAFRVLVTRGDGTVVADSGRVTSASKAWQAPRDILRNEGQTVTIEVRVWDAVDRLVTPGDPAYASATKDVTLSTTAGVNPPATVAATSDGIRPRVTVTATAEQAPDGWVVERNGQRVFRNNAATLNFTWTDWDVTPNHPVTYRVRRVVNGQVSAGGPSSTVTPRITGIWLVDPDDDDGALILGIDEGTRTAAELAVVHQPIGGPPIRRVAYRPPASGTVTGDLVDYDGVKSADASTAWLYRVKSSDPDRLLRLFLGDEVLLVNVGDITISPAPRSGVERYNRVSFSWWQVDDVPWKA